MGVQGLEIHETRGLQSGHIVTPLELVAALRDQNTSGLLEVQSEEQGGRSKDTWTCNGHDYKAGKWLRI